MRNRLRRAFSPARLLFALNAGRRRFEQEIRASLTTCHVVDWALYAMIIMAAVSTIVSAYGTYAASEAQAESQDYNADVAEVQAESARNLAAAEEERQRKRDRQTLAQMRASNQGVENTEGSPLLVLADSAKEAELNALTVRAGGEATAFGLLADARLNRLNARNSRTAGYIGAGSSLLSGAASGTGSYLKYTRKS